VDLGLRDKVAFVAASSKGLGHACAQTLSAEGAKVVVCSRSEENLRATAGSITAETGGTVWPVVADLSRVEDGARAIAQTVERFGALHVLVTNNGGPPAGGFSQFGEADWLGAFELTFMNAVRLARAALPVMQRQKWGRIINITSVSVKEPLDNLILSNAMRAGVTGMAKTLARDVAADGITVNNVLPGYFLTDRVRSLSAHQAAEQGRTEEEVVAEMGARVPRGTIGDPRELGAVVAFLASEQAAYVNGASILVDGGFYHGLM
jgi:3-oxoacyl-[acyl-carrier protein] reductase